MRQQHSIKLFKWRQHLTLDLPSTRAGCLWLHACSVGEVGSVAPLIRALLASGYDLHLSVVTATGFAHARRLLGNDVSVSFLPWDFPFAMSRMIRALQPALLLLAETEFWPGMLSACQQQHIPVIGINTRISDRSFPRYRATRMLWKRWLASVALFLPQSEVDAERLIGMGVAAEKIHVAGNLKYAVSTPDVDCEALRRRLDDSGERPLLLIASTHAGEDERILDMYATWHGVCPELLMVIVPRHPERFEQVATLIESRGHGLMRWSGQQQMGQEQVNNKRTDIVLIDAMGVLNGLYAIADAVVVAGSLTRIGGHNPLEAAICGRGVVTGPHIANFREAMREMQQAEAAIVCQNDRDMQAAISRLLTHADELRALNASAALFMQDRSHVLARILDAIRPWLMDSRSQAGS